MRRAALLLMACLLAGCGDPVRTTVTPAPTAPVAVASSPAASPTSSPSPPPQPLSVQLHGGAVSVPILMYHYIRTNPVASDTLGYRLSVPPADFRAQMDELRRRGAHTITPAQLVAALQGGGLPSHPVLLTFDDGYRDFATNAVPILRSDGFVGVNYVVSGFIGRSNYMTAVQVLQVQAEGMIIGCHTLTHPKLAGLPSDLQWSQINDSKQQLEALLGHPVVDFAYPYGSYDSTTLSLVQRAGFADAVTVQFGSRELAAAPLVMPRIEVIGGDSPATVAADAGV